MKTKILIRSKYYNAKLKSIIVEHNEISADNLVQLLDSLTKHKVEKSRKKRGMSGREVLTVNQAVEYVSKLKITHIEHKKIRTINTVYHKIDSFIAKPFDIEVSSYGNSFIKNFNHKMIHDCESALSTIFGTWYTAINDCPYVWGIYKLIEEDGVFTLYKVCHHINERIISEEVEDSYFDRY